MLLNKACLFPLYIVGFKFYSVTTDKVAPALKFKSASSKEKILRLNFLRSNLKSNLAKFVNLTSNLTHRDPHLENVNLNTQRDSVKFKPARSAATSHVQWGWRGHGRGRGDAS